LPRPAPRAGGMQRRTLRGSAGRLAELIRCGAPVPATRRPDARRDLGVV
jgi:hypothetical protein